MGVVRCQRCGDFTDLDYNVEDAVVLADGINWSCRDCLEPHEVCSECDEYRPDDERVKSGMKCAECAGYVGVSQ